MGNVLGIDIGNGTAFASILLDAKADPVGLMPAQNEMKDTGMPATAYLTPPKGTPIVVYQNGISAEKAAGRNKAYLVRAAKNRLREGTVQPGKLEAPVKVLDIYAAVTRDVLMLAHQEQRSKGMEPSHLVVFTFPAVLADEPELLDQMQQSIEEQEVDGKKIQVIGRLPEPAAVAVDYLYYKQNLIEEQQRLQQESYTVLVYDLGHGTFDVAVVTAYRQGQPFKLHYKDGLPDVGGKDFDKILYDEACRMLEEQYHYKPRNDMVREHILSDVVRVKHELSAAESGTIEVPIDEDYQDVTITRARFEELSRHLVLQTMDLVQEILDQAEEDGIQIDAVIMSGGASRMPMVENNLKALVGDRYPVVKHRPSEAVSYGAARYAEGISLKKEPHGQTGGTPSNTQLEQLTDRSYGIRTPSGDVAFLVASGTKRPAKSEPVRLRAQSTSLEVQLYRAKERNKQVEKASRQDCESMLRMRFDTRPGEDYQVWITLEENYSVRVTLRSSQGKVQEKSTSDSVEKLTEAWNDQ